MTKICNIRWGSVMRPAAKTPCGEYSVVEVMVVEDSRRIEFAMVVSEGPKVTMYISKFSLFDIFDNITCRCVDRLAEEEIAKGIADEVLDWNEEKLKATVILQPLHWEAVAAADAAMKMYLGAPWDDDDAVNEWMGNYLLSCQCEPASEARWEMMNSGVAPRDCAHCHEICKGNHNRADRPAPPTEI